MTIKLIIELLFYTKLPDFYQKKVTIYQAILQQPYHLSDSHRLRNNQTLINCCIPAKTKYLT